MNGVTRRGRDPNSQLLNVERRDLAAAERVQQASAVFFALVGRNIRLASPAVPSGLIGVLACRVRCGSCLRGMGGFGSDLHGGEFGVKRERGLGLWGVLDGVSQ